MPPHMNLKQRLAALSLSPSSPTTPHGPDTPTRSLPTKGRRRTFLNPWNKRQHDSAMNEEQEALERVQEVMGKMVFQAGVDFETRPMVVLNASALPDPREVSYDLMLSSILSYLDLYVESDYAVVFFAAGGRNTPGWNWVWKAYRSLSRKYRKNLKRLYIVHSSFFSKMLFSLAGAIISPKFFRKLSYTNTLSELACHVPLTQIDIPPAVYKENLKHEKEITLPIQTHSDIFGVPLEELMGYYGEKGGIPRVVKDCIQFLRETDMKEEGLFRRSPASLMLKQAQEAYDRGQVLSLESFGDPHLAAVLLKKYLRDLPEPIFPENLYPTIRRCPPPTNDPTDISSVMYIRDTILTELVPCVYILLSHVLHLLHDISLRSASNRMDAHNLALVLCPNLISGANALRDMSMCMIPGGPALHQSMIPTSPSAESDGRTATTTLGTVIKQCIQRYYEIFDEIRDRSEAILPPLDSEVRGEDDVAASSSEVSSVAGCLQQQPQQQQATHGVQIDEEDDIDDAMLVMPIGPNHAGPAPDVALSSSSSSPSPPSAWGGTAAAGAAVTTYKPRRRGTMPGSSFSGSGVRSVHTMPPSLGENNGGRGNGNGNGGNGFGDGHHGFYPSTMKNKSKSMVSIEKDLGGTVGTVGRFGKGSISVGRGTTRKSSGAGVEAISITAEGFFTPPNSTAPVPPHRR